MTAGYRHPAYAAALEEFGTPRELPKCRGWVLERQVPGFDYRDAMGCYPLFTCRDWPGLPDDLQALEDSLLTLSLVSDPFACLNPRDLGRHFDRFAPFKEHLVADMSQPPDRFVSRHHRYYARKALRYTAVEKMEQPFLFLDEWTRLYGGLIERHNLRGIKAFSEVSFARQFRVPGLVMFRCDYQGTAAGIHLWYVQNDVAYSHLAACSDDGYRLGAAYGLYWSALQYFHGKVAWLDLGAGAGLHQGESDGLRLFKEGWSTETRTAYFCGRILDAAKYKDVLSAQGGRLTEYFPAYRQGEMS